MTCRQSTDDGRRVSTTSADATHERPEAQARTIYYVRAIIVLRRGIDVQDSGGGALNNCVDHSDREGDEATSGAHQQQAIRRRANIMRQPRSKRTTCENATTTDDGRRRVRARSSNFRSSALLVKRDARAGPVPPRDEGGRDDLVKRDEGGRDRRAGIPPHPWCQDSGGQDCCSRLWRSEKKKSFPSFGLVTGSSN